MTPPNCFGILPIVLLVQTEAKLVSTSIPLGPGKLEQTCAVNKSIPVDPSTAMNSPDILLIVCLIGASHDVTPRI